jgi:hypothetical protein
MFTEKKELAQNVQVPSFYYKTYANCKFPHERKAKI